MISRCASTQGERSCRRGIRARIRSRQRRIYMRVPSGEQRNGADYGEILPDDMERSEWEGLIWCPRRRFEPLRVAVITRRMKSPQTKDGVAGGRTSEGHAPDGSEFGDGEHG